MTSAEGSRDYQNVLETHYPGVNSVRVLESALKNLVTHLEKPSDTSGKPSDTVIPENLVTPRNLATQPRYSRSSSTYTVIPLDSSS